VFLTYRQVNPPHDCFSCFNRLPGDAKYSIYQYTKGERSDFREQRTLGVGAVKEYERIYEQAKKDAQTSLNRSNRQLRKETLVVRKGFSSQQEAEQAYLLHKQQIQAQIDQLALLNQEPGHIRAIDRKELPFNESDVLRLGGSIVSYNSEDSRLSAVSDNYDNY
jgi:hypothetical protein